MRGGLERWKRGVDSHGVRAAIAYALDGGCDAHIRVASTGVVALGEYSEATAGVTRFTVVDQAISADRLDRDQLCLWVDGLDPVTGEQRGRALTSPRADLVLDGTINAPKSFSLVAMLHPDLAREFEALQDRLRDRVIRTWQRELNARRGAGGRVREPIHRLEVVELQHRRSRALDPHIHRHLWLSVKVQGADGQWSNVDSRVAMRLHTVINAEGELAARTDPVWVAALARHGYTLNVDGEVAEVAHAVRAMSRRSTQIERNRAVLLAQWQEQHPGQSPTPEVVAQIDRAAWRQDRPAKPRHLDEDEWAGMVRDELATIDPHLLTPRNPVTPPGADVAVDVGLLAEIALVEADARAVGTGGRFSLLDVRAGAMRAVAASGIVAPRGDLQPLIDQVTVAAFEMTIDLLDGEEDRPAHIKGHMALDTARLKIELGTRFDQLATPGTPAPTRAIARAAAEVLPVGVRGDDGQDTAAAAIAGTDRLVAVTGPAGTGKTTMLRVAHRCLQVQGRRMVVVAPTRKAASIAGREIGTDSSSLHALLADHGWRWGTDRAGAPVWSRLTPGQTDAVTGMRYPGPTRYPLHAGDRVVVDEAGMVDLHTATALAQLAAETGVGIAMVGDHLQAAPVGHAGAMAALTRRATAVVQLSTVHRFHDPDYAALTLRLREPDSRDDAVTIATALHHGGHILRVDDDTAARDAMVDGYFHWATRGRRVALVTATNEEADAVNEAIQQRRVERGELDRARVTVGMGEQRILEGDLVQTRRNDAHAGVENRALWTVARITQAELELEGLADPTEIRFVPVGYAAEHLHLAYASTVHGIQGETTDASLVGPHVDASGLYVGMTRGRTHNKAIAIARTPEDAVEQVADSMLRGLPETSIDDSIHAARTELDRAARPIPPRRDTTRAVLELQDRIEDLDRQIAARLRLLGDLARADATRDARAHGRADTSTGEARDPDQVWSLDAVVAEWCVERDQLDARRARLLAPTKPGGSAARSATTARASDPTPIDESPAIGL